jgi:pimeloyl-ACP methyl ester carboxylesterase/DNA-binding CsgD family transcriptional regulator
MRPMLRPKPLYAVASDGVTIAYAVIGDGPLTTVLVPGLLSQVEVAWEEPAFEQFMTRLAAFSRVIIFDRRGSGLSDPIGPDGLRITLDDLARDVAAVMDAAGIDRAALIGVSLGSMTAVQFAADYPDRVAAIALIGSTSKVTSAPGFPTGLDPSQIEAWADLVHKTWGTGAAVEADSAAMRENSRYRAWAARLERHTSSPGMLAHALRQAASYDAREALRRVKAPVLVLHRVGDRFASVEQARYIAANASDATYLELAGEDHTFFLGDQRVMLDAILQFLDDRVPGGELTVAARRAERKGGHGFGWQSLTPSEREVAVMVAAGMTNNEIAHRLKKSPHTVDGHVRRVFRKLNVTTRVGVASEHARVAQQ